MLRCVSPSQPHSLPPPALSAFGHCPCCFQCFGPLPLPSSFPTARTPTPAPAPAEAFRNNDQASPSGDWCPPERSGTAR